MMKFDDDDEKYGLILYNDVSREEASAQTAGIVKTAPLFSSALVGFDVI